MISREYPQICDTTLVSLHIISKEVGINHYKGNAIYRRTNIPDNDTEGTVSVKPTVDNL